MNLILVPAYTLKRRDCRTKATHEASAAAPKSECKEAAADTDADRLMQADVLKFGADATRTTSAHYADTIASERTVAATLRLVDALRTWYKRPSPALYWTWMVPFVPLVKSLALVVLVTLVALVPFWACDRLLRSSGMQLRSGWLIEPAGIRETAALVKSVVCGFELNTISTEMLAAGCSE